MKLPNTPHKPRFRFIIAVPLAISAIVCALIISSHMIEAEAHILPDYPKINIDYILSQEKLNEKDYEILYYQTGLGKPAIDELYNNSSYFRQQMLSLQSNLFSDILYVCEKNSIISREESVVDDKGNYSHGTELSPIQNGDILITKASHTYGWRNGHAALVVDAENGLTLECVVLGTDSCLQNISKWTNYPNFMVFRLRDASQKIRNDIAQSALKNLNSIPYSLTIGVFSPKFKKAEEIDRTNCSHLVWQAFKLFDYDLDSDNSRIVTPKSIANSPLLEVVQVFGVNPENIWP